MATTSAGPDEDEDFDARVRARLGALKPAERQVAEYLLDHQTDVLFASAGELGTAAGTSDATVVRTAKALGYSGLPELKRHLGQTLTRRTEPAVRLNNAIERLGPAGAHPVDQVVAEGMERLQELRRQIDPADLDAAAEAILAARQIFTWGLGLSANCAEYAAVRLARRGLLTRYCPDTGFRLADALLPLSADDVLIAYVPARHNQDVEAILTHARRTGAAVVLVTSKLSTELRERVRVVLFAPDSPTKFTGEVLTASLVTDMLTMAVAARRPERAGATTDLLTDLRGRLGERKR